MNNLFERLRNPLLVSSVLSTTFLILSGLGVINIPDNTINVIVNSIMSILSILGVLNAPYKNVDYIDNDNNDNNNN